jgi:hypothetical protein
MYLQSTSSTRHRLASLFGSNLKNVTLFREEIASCWFRFNCGRACDVACLGPQHVLRIKGRAGLWAHGHVQPITSGPRDYRMFTALRKGV